MTPLIVPWRREPPVRPRWRVGEDRHREAETAAMILRGPGGGGVSLRESIATGVVMPARVR